MYTYIDTGNEHFKNLEEFGKDMVVEILKMIPENYQNYTNELCQALEVRDYDTIQRSVHTIKSDFRHLISIQNPVIIFLQDFEDRAREKWDEKKESGEVKAHHDFTPDYEKLLEITRPALDEIIHFAEEYSNS